MCARLLVQTHRELWDEGVLTWDMGIGVVCSACVGILSTQIDESISHYSSLQSSDGFDAEYFMYLSFVLVLGVCVCMFTCLHRCVCMCVICVHTHTWVCAYVHTCV